MKMNFLFKVNVLILGITCVSIAQVNYHDSLTVSDAVRIALAENPSLKQGVHEIAASEARVEQSKSSLYPNAAATLNYTHLGPVAQLGFPGFGEFKLFPSDNYDEHIGASVTLFDFERRQKSIQLAQTQVQSAADKLDLMKLDLSYQTIQTFYTILFLQKSIQVQNDEIATLREHLLVTKKKVEAGTGTDFDVLTTEVRVAAAENKRISLENSLMNAETEMRRLLNFPPNVPLRLVGSFAESPVSLNVDSLLNVAVRNRVELKMADDQIKTAIAQYKVASAVNNPSVNLSLAYGFKNGYEPNINAWRGNYVAALQVQIPVFDGYRENKMKDEASENVKAAESYREDVLEKIKSDVQIAIADLRSSIEKLQTTDITIQQAESALQLARLRYQAGTVTNLDLLDSETALAEARLMQLEALYRFAISRYELGHALGLKEW
jgi:Outer membrane protein